VTDFFCASSPVIPCFSAFLPVALASVDDLMSYYYMQLADNLYT